MRRRAAGVKHALTEQRWAIESVEKATGHFFHPKAPAEDFSFNPPLRFLPLLDHGAFPIDGVLGTYNVRTNRIELYTENIQECCARLGFDPVVLTAIVRLHELGHGLIAYGIPLAANNTKANKKFDVPKIDDETKWDDYKGQRLSLYKKIGGGKGGWDNPSFDHEFLAQSITWLAIEQSEYGHPLGRSFLRLMEKQPDEYVLTSEDQCTAIKRLWNWSGDCKLHMSKFLWARVDSDEYQDGDIRHNLTKKS